MDILNVIKKLRDDLKAWVKNNLEALNNKVENKMNKDELDNAVNIALSEAKESGEFDGKDGVDGKDGYTPVKGVDYFDGIDGKDGAPGKDGVDGKDGLDGKDGVDGRTPEKGVDYFTDEDKQEFIEDVIENIDIPEGGVTSWNDLTDKPFGEDESEIAYESIGSISTSLITTVTDQTVNITGTLSKPLVEGETYRVVVSYPTVAVTRSDFECVCTKKVIMAGVMENLILSGTDCEIWALNGTLTTNATVMVHGTHGMPTVSVSVYAKKEAVKTLDEKYIPDTIARVEDIPSIEDLATEQYVDDAIANIDISGGGGVTSWDELKDKPFYEESEIAELVSNLTTEAYNNRQFSPCNFIVGEKYNVIWNNESYNDLICYELDGCRVIGGEGYPFYIDDDGGNSLYIESTTDETDFVVTVIGKRVTIKTIDEKFLPAWDDLKNKPFGEIPPVFDITWDGDMTGHDIFDYGDGNYDVKVSDEVFTKEQLLNSTTFYFDGYEVINTEEDIFVDDDFGIISSNGFFIVINAEKLNSMAELPEGTYSNGVWFNNWTGEEPWYTNRLVAATTIKKIDKEYLPDTEVSWNDLTDKPFGEDINKHDFVDSIHISFSNNKSMNNTLDSLINEAGGFIVDKTYGVSIDGNLYECICVRVALSSMFGTIIYANELHAVGEHGVSINFNTSYNKYIVTATVADGTHTIAIYEINKTLQKIDEKFIPDTIATKQYVDEAIANTDKEVSWNNITDKPFGEETTFSNLIYTSNMGEFTFNKIGDKLYSSLGNIDISIKDNTKYRLEVSYMGTAICSTIEGIARYDSTTKQYYISAVDNGHFYYSIDFKELYIVCVSETPLEGSTMLFVKIYEGTTVDKQIDEKFIPNTIARVKDIPSTEGLATEEYVDNAISNIEISGGGGVTSWNDLEDKPFEYIPPLFDIQWDGDATGRQTISYNTGYYVKVSDEVFTKEQLVNSLMYYSYDDTVLNEESDLYVEDKYGVINLFVADAIVIYSAEEYIEASGRPEGSVSNGVWFWCTNGGEYVNRLVAPFTLKTLDKKFLPDTVVLESELEAKGYQTKEQVTELINNALGVIENGTY